MEINKARRNDQSFHVEDSFARSRLEDTDFRDLAVANADVALETGLESSVDDGPVHQHQIFRQCGRGNEYNAYEDGGSSHSSILIL